MNLDKPTLGETSYHGVDSSLYDTALAPFPCMMPEYSIPTYIAQNHRMHPVSVAGRDIPFLPDSDTGPMVVPHSLIVNSPPPSLHGPPAPQYPAPDVSPSLTSTYDTG